MDKIGLFYGSSTGATRSVAERIARAFGPDEVELHDIAQADARQVEKYERLIFGVSTWGLGEMQDDWEAFSRRMNSLQLAGRTVALFGLGDQRAYPDTFLNALGTLYEKVKQRGGTVVGTWPTEGYEFTDSTAERDGRFVGLAIDEDSQPERTARRIADWVEQIRPQMR